MQLKDKLLQLLNDDKYVKMNVSEISSFFALNTDEFKQLVKIINELDESGHLFISKNGYIHLASKVNIYQGRIISVKKYFAICLVKNGAEEFEVKIPEEKLNNAYINDIVKVQIADNLMGSVIEIIKHSLWEMVCEFSDKKFLPDDKFFPYEVKVKKDNKLHLVDGHIVHLHIDSYEENKINCSIVKILGHKNDVGVDILSLVIKSGVNYEFSESLLKECDKIITQKLNSVDYNKRLNLEEELIVTIDGIDAKDLDDAISLKILDNGNYYLGVHIADVTYFVEDGNIIDKEAYQRGTSIYLADRVIPMLPFTLSNGACSLSPDERKLTVSCFMEIDYEGSIVNYDIKESFIKSKARLNYKDVNSLFNNEKTSFEYSKDLKKMLFNMKILSNILSKKMRTNGYLELDIAEAKLQIDGVTNKVVGIAKRETGESEKLIENFMICANECVASHIYYQALPYVYRIHPVPKREKILGLAQTLKAFHIDMNVKNKFFSAKLLQKILDDIKGNPDQEIISDTILRSLTKAVYSVENVGHFGLGSQVYTHFTSPIRRYPDILVHRYLKKYEFQHDYDVDLEYLIKACEDASLTERRAVSLERDVEDMKKAEFMEQFIGCVYEGIVTSIMDFGVFVKLDNTCEGLMRYNYYDKVNLKLGQKVKVKLISVNVKRGDIDFEYYKPVSIRRKYYGKNNRKK